MEQFIKKSDFDFKLLEVQNRFYNLAISKVDFVKTILKKYDGKKITKRIETELNKLNDNKNIYYGLKKDFNSWELYIYTNDRCYLGEADKNGVCRANYIEDSHFYFFYSYQDDKHFDYVNYKLMEEKININVNYRIEQMKKQEEVIKKLDELIEERNVILNKVEENTKQLQELRNCFVGREYWLNCKIK